MKAILFGDKEVEIDPHSLDCGGSWSPGFDNPRGTAWEHTTIARFWEKSLGYSSPALVDVGASTGSYCLMAKFHPGMEVWAFEPNPAIFEILTTNINLNGLNDRVHTIQKAVSEKPGLVVLSVPPLPTDSGLATIGKPARFIGGSSVHATSCRLDGLLSRIDMLKIDTEGAEMLVILGAEQLIKRCHPIILCECTSLNDPQFDNTAQDTIDLLVGWGASYALWDADNAFFWWDR